MQLRTYRRADLDALFALDEQCFAPTFRFSRSAMRRFAEAPNAYTLLAEEDGKLSGFCILHVERIAKYSVGYVVTLDVSAAERRKGIARTLMAGVEREAAHSGCLSTMLHVHVGNDAAIRFYERLGYVRAENEADFYGPGVSAAVYRKALKIA